MATPKGRHPLYSVEWWVQVESNHLIAGRKKGKTCVVLPAIPVSLIPAIPPPGFWLPTDAPSSQRRKAHFLPNRV
jgi:hypothetical protein